MAVIKGLEWTFDTVAAEYDRWSPPYVDALYDDLFAYIGIDGGSSALEIGIGTGQATQPILDKGCALTAVELGKNLSEFTRQKFGAYKNLTVVNQPFQEYMCDDNTYDLIYSAGAFHWIPEEIGYKRVYDLLKPGGAFARFAKHPYYDKDKQQAMHDDIQKVYREYMSYSSPSPEYTARNASDRADIAAKYGFTDIMWKLYRRTRSYSSDDYIRLIATFSDHIVLEESKRAGFYGGIKSAIDAHGGSITLFDTIDLQVARKPL